MHGALQMNEARVNMYNDALVATAIGHFDTDVFMHMAAAQAHDLVSNVANRRGMRLIGLVDDRIACRRLLFFVGQGITPIRIDLSYKYALGRHVMQTGSESSDEKSTQYRKRKPAANLLTFVLKIIILIKLFLEIAR